MAGDVNRSEQLGRSEGKPRRLRSTLGVRLAGAALCTAGLAFIGFGTVGSQWSLFSAKNAGVVADPGCDSTTTNCLNESFEGNTIAQDNVQCDFTSQFPNEDGFLFVLPTKGNSNPTFVPGTFFAVFQGIGSPVQGTVGVPGVANGAQKFAVVYVPAGSVLEEAYSQATNGSPVFGDDFNVTGGCDATTTTTTTSTGSTATVSTTKTVTAPGTTVTTTVSGPTTTTTAPGTTQTTTKTVSTATTVTSPTTVTNNTTATTTATTTVNTTVTKTTTAPGTTVATTVTAPTTVTNTATTTVTSNHTATTTVTAPTTVTAHTTVTSSATATTTKTVTTGSAGSPTSSTSSSSSSTPTSGVQAATTTPSTGSGSDIAFGTGLVLLVAGGGLIAGATRITRRKKN